MGAWGCKKNVRQGGKERKERLRKRGLGNGKKSVRQRGEERKKEIEKEKKDYGMGEKG